MQIKALLLLALISGTSFAWWDASFLYRTQVNISNSGSALTDYQAAITLNTQAPVLAGKMRSDCGDIRITNSTDSILPYWVETACNSTATKIWVKVPAIASGANTVYIYYGNPLATYNNTLGGNSTFDAFDLTSFTEYDPSGHLTVNNATKVSWSGNMYQSTSYLYHPISSRSDVIVDFEYQDTSSQTIAIGFADSTGAVKQVTNGIYAVTYTPGGARGFYIDHATSGTVASSSSYISYGASLYYARFTRIGTTVALHLFSDAARTAEIAGSPITYTDTSAAPVNLFYAISGRAESTGGFAMTGFAQNFRVRKYSSTEPTASIIAEEEALQFTYRKDILLNNTGSALSDYQVNLTIDTAALILAGKMKADCADMRFTNSTSDNTQNWTSSYNYWIESGCNTSATMLWVKVPSIPAGTSTIFAYYGNASAISASKGTATFNLFYADKTGLTGDTGSYAVDSGGWIYRSAASGSYLGLSFPKPSGSWIYDATVKNSAGAYGGGIGIGDGASGVGVTSYGSLIFMWDSGDQYYSYLVPVGYDGFVALNVSTNQTYTLSYSWDGTTLKALRDGTELWNYAYANMANIAYLRLATHQQNALAKNLRVRKYASPEPTATEQQPDTTPPAITIQSPNNTTYNTSTVNVNFTATDDAGFSCTVRLNGTVNSSTCGNYTLTLANGAYVLNVTVNDTSGNANSTQVSFSVTIPAGLQINTTQATTDINGIAAGNISFAFTPGTLRISAGAQETIKEITRSAGVNKIEIRAKITLSGQAVPGKQVTYTLSE